jgi:hypothetical protein
MKIDPLVATVLVGFGATFVMDVWTVFLNRAFAVPLPNYCFIGRWLRHMASGAFTHPSIAAASRQPAECPIGWLAHYTIGALFALALVAFATPQWLQSPTLMPALLFGIVTVVFPLFIMQPAFGLGIAASKAPNPVQARLRSLMNHVVFGIGLYLSAQALSSLIEARA